MKSKHYKCAELALEALNHLQSLKIGKLSSAIRKIELIARLTDDKPLLRWCEFQLGEYQHQFMQILEKGIDEEAVNIIIIKIEELNIPLTHQEIFTRLTKAGGGFKSIESIEQIFEKLNKGKRGNDGTYYLDNIQDTISSCSNAAAKHASRIYSTYSFGEIPRQQFDLIRERVDDLLLNICPDAVEKFMSAYEKLASPSSEDWSLALTSCRRIIKAVADSIFPPRTNNFNGRSVGEEQYINRLWAFLDQNVPSGSDKDLAKAHVDYLGAFMQKLNDKVSKGVHATVVHKEAIRIVLYTYLTLGDILEFANKGLKKTLSDKGKIDINSASIEELSSVPGITRDLAKEIIKIRVKGKFKSIKELSIIKGVGLKTIEKISSKAIAI
ncbi:MAG: hypothetical protein A2161_21375 [Candidatus Schekmanbacteria bacterium RBG_13_48_7]|uniref:Helix-hairpin-helix DNA-binding motif class 1 domain-containing protein n=1 Tax=Candidatus Schekmanbacteria bacterium RBG_13_48_7 TaxID=1817878 RepID=A0A1F7RUK1_9BACT|nr:MAG: hypothetical protein A2161_21375 [Candidatus Schekmanbacteria bacterium RBG_13_48_7]